jgi:hypothetical protein
MKVSEAWWKASTPEEQEILQRMRNKVRARMQSKNEFPGSDKEFRRRNLERRR